MANGCHIENCFLAISRRFIARLTRNSVRWSTVMFRYKSRDQNTKFGKLKMADGRHFKNDFFSLYSYLSGDSSNFNEIWRVDADFGSNSSHVAKYQNFANPIRRPAAILKIVFGYISTIYCPINAKFGTKKQDHVRHRSHDQNAKYLKFKMADGRQFENCLIAISQPKIIRFQWNLVCRRRFSF